MAHVGRWSSETLRRRGDQSRRVLAANPGDEIRLSRVRAELGNVWQSRIAARVLDQSGRLVDDTESPTRRWIDRRTATLPPGFRDDVRAWLLVLHEGEQRARPRAEATLHAYFSRAHPPLTQWVHEALSTNADPLHLTVMFGLSEKSAADYAGLARGLTDRPIGSISDL